MPEVISSYVAFVAKLDVSRGAGDLLPDTGRLARSGNPGLGHGGELMVMMQENQVVHVMSVHEVVGWLMLRDVFGDRVYPSREEIDQEEIDRISELHLLGTRVSHLFWIDADCTKLPCRHPTEDEIAEARQRLSVLRPLGEHGPKMADQKEALPSLTF